MNSINKTRSLRFRALFSSLLVLFVLIGGLVLTLESKNVAFAVVGGTNVDKSDPYPFLGLFYGYAKDPRIFFWQDQVSTHCGATLINPSWALTAEHCIEHKEKGRLKSGHYTTMTITFGTIFSNGSGGEKSNVDYYIAQPGSDPYHDKNDLALLHLSKPVNNITPVSLGGSCPDWHVGSKALSAGWGQRNTDSQNLEPTKAMEKADLELLDIVTSLDLNAPKFDPQEYVKTAETFGSLKFGDSGNGLLFQEPNGQYVLLGVLHGFIPNEPADAIGKVEVWERTDMGSSNFSFIQKYLSLPNAPASCTSGPPPTSQPPTTQQPPTVPTGLHMTSRTASSVSIAWNAVPGATGYRVYNGETQVAQVTGASATATGLKDNTSYAFTVAAYNGVGQSTQSIPLTVQTLPTWRFAVLSQNVYDDTGKAADLGHLRPSQHGRIVITIRNTGSATWTNSGANPVMLGTDHPRDRASAITTTGWISSSRPAYLSEAQVPPGGQGTFAFPFAAPSSAGTVTEYFTPVAQGLSWFDDVGLYLKFTVVPVVGVAFAPGTDSGQWVVAADGGVFAYSGAGFYGSMGGQHLNQPVVGITATPTGKGYWLVAGDGGVFAYGDASYYGSMVNQHLNQPVVGITVTPMGKGYWLVAADGGVFAFGDASYYGSMAGHPLNKPVVGITATPTGKGYWLAAGDGGVFAYGDASYYGSMANQHLNKPIVGITTTPTGKGYWLVAADGGVFAYGDAGYYGSMGASGASRPVVGITTTPRGYFLVDVTGAVQSFDSP